MSSTGTGTRNRSNVDVSQKPLSQTAFILVPKLHSRCQHRRRLSACCSFTSTDRGSEHAKPRASSPWTRSERTRTSRPLWCLSDHRAPSEPLPPPAPSASTFSRGASALRSVFRRSPLDAEIFRLALPALGALVIDPLMGLVDTLFVARVRLPDAPAIPSAAPLAGVGMATMLLNFSVAIFNSLAIATTPSVAAAAARGDHARASRLMAQSLWTACSIGVGLALLIAAFSPLLLARMGARGAVLGYAVAYVRSRAVAVPFALGSMVLWGAFRGYRDTATPFRIALASNMVNFVGDAVLIFPCDLHVIGAALATAASQMLTFAAMLTVLARRGAATTSGGDGQVGNVWQSLVHRVVGRQSRASGMLRLADLRQPPSFADIRPLLTAGALVTVRTVSNVTTVVYATSIAAQTGGAVASAAFEILRQVWITTAMLCDSLSVAAQALVASALGGGQLVRGGDEAVATAAGSNGTVREEVIAPPYTLATVRARIVANRLLQLGVVAGSALSLIALSPLGSQGIPHVFSPDSLVQQAAASGMRIMGFMLPINAVVFVLDGVAIGATDYAYIAKAVSCTSLCAIGALEVTRRHLLAHSASVGAVTAPLVVQRVWTAMNVLMLGRITAMLLRYIAPQGPVPPLRRQLRASGRQEAQADATEPERQGER